MLLRGDANGDRQIDIGDPIHTLSYLFAEGPVSFCLARADANDDGEIDISDPISTLAALFAQQPLPPPYPSLGPEPDPKTDCEWNLWEGLGPGIPLRVYLRFKVVDRFTLRPIPGATINVGGHIGGGTGIEFTTDENGVAEGTYGWGFEEQKMPLSVDDETENGAIGDYFQLRSEISVEQNKYVVIGLLPYRQTTTSELFSDNLYLASPFPLGILIATDKLVDVMAKDI